MAREEEEREDTKDEISCDEYLERREKFTTDASKSVMAREEEREDTKDEISCDEYLGNSELYDRCLQAVYESEEQAELNTETSCIELEEFNQLEGILNQKFTDDKFDGHESFKNQNEAKFTFKCEIKL